MDNIILDRLPNYTLSGNRIRTDFRESIKFELLMQDSSLDKKTQLELALNLYYYEVPKDIEQAVNDIIWFYTCGKKMKTSRKEKEEKQKQIYSYEFDDGYIFSSFVQQYKIDLNSIKYMHWWKFKALFEGLNKNTKMVEIMGYRAVDISKIKDKEERKHYKRLQKQYALPDMRTTEQKEADFGRAFW